MRRFAYVAILLAVFFVLPSRVSAEQFSLSISPSSYEIISKKGQTITIPYTISNVGDPILVKLKMYVFSQKDSQGSYEVIPASDIPGASQFIFSTNNASITLEKPFLFFPDQTYSFDLTMQIPQNAIEKDYYFTVIAEAEDQTGFSNQSSILLQGGIGSLIYVSLTENGAILQEPSIALFDIRTPYTMVLGEKKYTFINSNQPIPVILSVANKGKNYLQLSGAVFMDSLFSEKPTHETLEKLTENTESSSKINPKSPFLIMRQPILGSTQKLLKTAQNPACINERVQDCTDDVSVVLNGRLSGLYRISTLLSLEDSPDKSLYEERYIIIFPFKLSAIIGTLFLLSLAFITLYKKAKRKK